MPEPNRLEGVIAPVLTPFDTAGHADAKRFTAHAKWLLASGITGLAPFGTTSEATSLGLAERQNLLDAMIADDVPSEVLMPGTGLASVPDTAALTAHAVGHGVAGVLMLPPFYYKGVSDDGIFGHVADVIERVGDARLKIYLYHIPQVAQAGYSIDLISRLRSAYPETVVGLKDSSGDWSNTQAAIRTHPGFDVFAGSEVFLLQTLRAGGAGCITATANVNPGPLRNVFDCWKSHNADALQAAISDTRRTIQNYPMIPALKAIKASMLSDPVWAFPRPPLEQLSSEAATALINALKADQSFAGLKDRAA